MAELTLREITARLVAQDAEIAALHARLAAAERRARRRRRTPWPRRMGGALTVALLVALVPLSILAANPFTDLTGGVHDANIDAIYTAGITTGCAPTESCPTANVTREEMASFLARTAGLGNNKPVANAARLAVANPVAGGATYAANDLVRLASNIAFDKVLGTADPATLATVTITVPVGGYVLVEANTSVYNNAAAGCICGVQASIREAGAITSSDLQYTTLYNASGGTDSNSPLALSWVFPAAAGQHTYELRARRYSGSAVITTRSIRMTALFVPFNATGGTP
jgi:hypothetical protein